jgi:hypothetical protein
MGTQPIQRGCRKREGHSDRCVWREGQDPVYFQLLKSEALFFFCTLVRGIWGFVSPPQPSRGKRKLSSLSHIVIKKLAVSTWRDLYLPDRKGI